MVAENAEYVSSGPPYENNCTWACRQGFWKDGSDLCSACSLLQCSAGQYRSPCGVDQDGRCGECNGNVKPANSSFVFSADVLDKGSCVWECDEGFFRDVSGSGQCISCSLISCPVGSQPDCPAATSGSPSCADCPSIPDNSGFTGGCDWACNVGYATPLSSSTSTCVAARSIFVLLVWNMFLADFTSAQGDIFVRQSVATVAGVHMQDARVALVREFAVAVRRQSPNNKPQLEVTVEAVVPLSRATLSEALLTTEAISAAFVSAGFEPPLSSSLVSDPLLGPEGGGYGNVSVSGLLLFGGLKFERRACADAEQVACMRFASGAILPQGDSLCVEECNHNHELNVASQSVFWINMADILCQFMVFVLIVAYARQADARSGHAKVLYIAWVTFVFADIILESGALYHAWLMQRAAESLLDNFCLASNRAGLDLVRNLSQLVASVITVGAIEMGVAGMETAVELCQVGTGRGQGSAKWGQVLLSFANLALTCTDFYFTLKGKDEAFAVRLSLLSRDSSWCYVALGRESEAQELDAPLGQGTEVLASSGAYVGFAVGAVFLFTFLVLLACPSLLVRPENDNDGDDDDNGGANNNANPPFHLGAQVGV